MIRLGLHRMIDSLLRRGIVLALAVLASIALHQPAANAQGTIGNGATSGVSVDAEGVLRRTSVQDPTGDLSRQRVQEALGKLDHDVAKTSQLRKVSLTRLERIMQK